MRFTFTLTCILFSFFASAQINVQWASRFTSSGSFVDQAVELTRDTAGNTYVTGTSWGGANFNIVTVKYDPSGNQLWMASYNGAFNGFDEARGIAVDNNFVYVCGTMQAAATNYNYVTIKYDIATGTQQWATTYNGPANGYDETFDVTYDASGNSYVTGSSDGSGTGADYATIKYNSAGVQQWASRYNNSGTGIDASYTVALDPSNNVYISGYSWGGTGNDFDIATIKYNNAGTQQWVRRYNGPGNKLDTEKDMIVDAAGNVYVTGQARALVGVTNWDIVTIKYNTAGTQQWLASYAGAGNEDDRGNAITLDNSGNVIITGRSIGTSQTAEDIVTIKYDGAAGTQLWENRFDGGIVGLDEGNDVAVDVANNVYVTGYSFGGSTNHNYITIKYDTGGTQQWLTRYIGPANNGTDKAYSMNVDVIGNVFVTGYSKGATSNEDFYTIKYCQLTASAGQDTAVCLGDAVVLQASVDSGSIDSAWWLPQAGLSAPNSATTTASPTVTTTYVLSVRNPNGCIDQDSVTVTVNPLPGPTISSSGPTTFCIGDSIVLTANTTGPAQFLWSPTGDTTQSTTATQSGTYSVIVSDTNTCSSQSQVTVTVNGLPVVNAGPDTSLCTSSQLNLCATGALNYSWGPNFGISDTTIACPTFGPTSSTTYTVTGTDANGCSSSDTMTISLLPPPPVPNVFMVVPDYHATPGYNSYQWYYNNTPIPSANDSIYTPTQNGSYYVVVTDANGCSTFSGTLTLIDVGVGEWALNANLQLYPNPNNGAFTLSFFAADEPAQVKIVAANGQLVYSEQIRESGLVQKTLQPGLAEGFYLLYFETGGKQLVRKLSVIR